MATPGECYAQGHQSAMGLGGKPWCAGASFQEAAAVAGSGQPVGSKPCSEG